MSLICLLAIFMDDTGYVASIYGRATAFITLGPLSMLLTISSLAAAPPSHASTTNPAGNRLPYVYAHQSWPTPQQIHGLQEACNRQSETCLPLHGMRSLRQQAAAAACAATEKLLTKRMIMGSWTAGMTCVALHQGGHQLHPVKCKTPSI